MDLFFYLFFYGLPERLGVGGGGTSRAPPTRLDHPLLDRSIPDVDKPGEKRGKWPRTCVWYAVVVMLLA